MPFAKWVLPPLVFVSISAYMFWKESQKSTPHFLILFVSLSILAVVFILVLRKRMWSLADEVLDGGAYLLVRFGSRQASINISDISDIHIEHQIGATTIRLRLATPCEFGEAVSFLAISSSRNPSAPNKIAEDLIARVQGPK